jgi:hypothetical protein
MNNRKLYDLADEIRDLAEHLGTSIPGGVETDLLKIEDDLIDIGSLLNQAQLTVEDLLSENYQKQQNADAY